MTAQAATMEFQAEARQLLDLVIHSLYSHKEIFLRELVSNASDALDKLRFEALKDPALLEGDARLRIELVPDSDARTLTIVDNGVGMDRDEVIANIGTIASSGTRRFLEELKHKGERADVPELIGQFGVGFYAAFMVADDVTVETRRAGSDKGVRWQSAGEGSYTLEEADGLARGTRITLKLREIDAEEAGAADYTQEWVLRDVIRRYSDFVEYPIEMEIERQQPVAKAEDAEEDDDAEPEMETVRETVTLNSMRPLWTRSKADITEDEYTEFYKHLTREWEPPLDTIHFKAEGTTEYTALLFLPSRKPMGLFDPTEAKSRISLYVRKVFITDDCEELAPVWLRFVRGLVDSSDLPLNVSRETLQHARQLGQIKKRLTRKVLDAFGTLLADRREDYVKFWGQFGAVIKEGLYYDDDVREDLAKVCLFHTTAGDELTSLDEYVGRMPEGQEAIYVLSAPDLTAARRSPHLEAFKAKGYEVLLMVDQVDEFALQRLDEFDGKPLRSIAKGQVDLGDEDSKAKLEEQSKELEGLLEGVKEKLAEHVSEVRLSTRLTDSAAVLVSAEHSMAPHVERMMRESGQSFGPAMAKRTLELNPTHPIVKRLEGLRESDGGRFGDYCELLLGQALLAEGSPVPDPGHLAKLMTDLMVGDAAG
ncbi:molecular chaperone HtpG [Engelhardtia mirabilis]|uniref:Chaperone protein HtpG n=1 Tax=Engelhardtia mirabilis TaxID=2528011 RepID=A0A518BMR9_9BACT|nr:Chaperone protein HtpG [Planctomycetes bacterium Pla133]QDV02605.1 Chaperone protein HtpG [Planctomycetes bacterium Pla86]